MFCFNEIVLFQFCFSVFTCETKTLKQNKSERGLSVMTSSSVACVVVGDWLKHCLKRFKIVSVFCFCFISHVCMSEMKLKQHCFVSVLFLMFYFRCNH